MMAKDSIKVRRATADDLDYIAHINSTVFLGDRDRVDGAREWVECWWRAFPLYQYFIVDVNGRSGGYAGWQLHGGFHRAEPAIELDQIGIDPSHQGRGLAPVLMKESMDVLSSWIQEKNDRIESHVTFIVWAYTLNFNAMSVYAKLFGEGARGFRVQFGDRPENMLRLRQPIIRRVRDT